MNMLTRSVSIAAASAAILAGEGAMSAPVQALVSSSGKVTLRASGAEVGTLVPGLYESGWRGASFGPTAGLPEDGRPLSGLAKSPSGIELTSDITVREADGGIAVRCVLTPKAPISVNSLHVGLDIPAAELAGRSYTIDGQAAIVPETRGDTHLSNKPTESIALDTAHGGRITLTFPSPTHVLLQDNRQWGPSFVVRVGEQHNPAATIPAAPVEFRFHMAFSQGVALDIDRPVTITAGDDWIPLDYDVEIEPGSVLDFSGMGFHDAPAGKHGRLLSRPNGTFAFADSPDVPRRFYGVNFCFSAHYLEKAEADRLAGRIARMGYNTIRIHHHESMLVRQSPRTSSSVADIPTDTNPDRTEQITKLQTPSSEADRYGQRLSGFLHPPRSGDYVFKVASDDNSELWLSTDETEDRKRRIASVSGWTGTDEFDKYPTQISDPVHLRAGQRYWLCVLHKEGSGGDHVHVAWEGPGIEQQTIAGEALSTPDGRRGAALREVWGGKKAEERKDSTVLIPERLDQLDTFIAAFRKRGIYITTDLYVSRPVYASELHDGADGNVAMDEFKMAVPVDERAFENWKAFSRNLLTHRNPYTGMTYAADPALAWLSMINEGNVGNHLGGLKGRLREQWRAAWNDWLAQRYASHQALADAWERDPKGDPRQGTVPLHTDIRDTSPAGRDLATFCAFIEERMFRRMKAFLRDEIGCAALLTNMNGWTNRVATHAAREDFDYVDDHFYVDHPHFLVNRWQLPSSCSNTSPIRNRAPGGRSNSFVRVVGKPFTISEYNYSGPGRFRGVGGILTGCLGALQGWDVIWRFAYSHSKGNLFKPSTAGYFDIVADPLNQVADRAAVCLYLRGDLREAPHMVALAFDPRDLRAGSVANRGVNPEWSELAWVTKVGTALTGQMEGVSPDVVYPVGPGAARALGREDAGGKAYEASVGRHIVEQMQSKGWLREVDPATWRKVLRSETGELTIDAPRDVFLLDTPRTAGGYAPEGETIRTTSVTVDMDRTYGTVWVSSMDAQPITDSRRLILCHLTDLQNTGARFGEKARKTLFAWGSLPHLVHDGQATVRIRTRHADSATVYALSTSGRRLHTVPAQAEGEELIIRPAVRGPDGKARLLYEIAAE